MSSTITDDKEENATVVLKTDEHLGEPIRTYTLDTLFKNLGHCGRFQVIFVSLGYFPLLPAAWTLMFMIFASYNPGWTCQDPLTVNVTEFLEPSGNKSLIAAQDGQSLIGNSSMFSSSCEAKRLCANIVFNDKASTVVTEWALVCDDAWKYNLIFAINMIGLVCGSCISGIFGDNCGRKFNVHGCAALLTITNIIAIFSVSWQMYAVMNFFIGFASGGILTSVAVYNFEFIPNWWRAFIGTFPFWNIGTTTLSLCVLALMNWKYVQMAIAFVSFLAFLPVFWLPESLRFLTIHGKLKKGHKVVRKISRINKRPVPDTAIMAVIAETEKENMKARSKYTYWDLFNKNNCKNSIVLGLAWFILASENYLVGFGLNALFGDFFVNFVVFTFIPFPMRLLATAFATKVGRKWASIILVSSSSLCTIALIAVQVLASDADKRIPTLVLAFGAHMLMEASGGCVVVLTIELNPTGIRNMSYGFCNILARIGAMISPFVVRRDSLPLFGSFLVLGFLQLIFILAMLTLPETKNRPLQDNLSTTSRNNKSQQL